MKTKDWSKLPHFPAPDPRGKGETKWVNPETFFDQLPAVMKEVPPLPGEEALYKWIGSVLDAAAKDPKIKTDAQGNCCRGRARDDRPVLSVAQQRPPRRQRLELASEQCEVGNRLPQSHGLPPSRICTTTDRRRPSTSTRTMTAWASNSMGKNTYTITFAERPGTSGQGILVDDPVQRDALSSTPTR